MKKLLFLILILSLYNKSEAMTIQEENYFKDIMKASKIIQRTILLSPSDIRSQITQITSLVQDLNNDRLIFANDSQRVNKINNLILGLNRKIQELNKALQNPYL